MASEPAIRARRHQRLLVFGAPFAGYPGTDDGNLLVVHPHQSVGDAAALGSGETSVLRISPHPASPAVFLSDPVELPAEELRFDNGWPQSHRRLYPPGQKFRSGIARWELPRFTGRGCTALPSSRRVILTA